eukprot:67044-Rhodomonas_salina.1
MCGIPQVLDGKYTGSGVKPTAPPTVPAGAPGFPPSFCVFPLLMHPLRHVLCIPYVLFGTVIGTAAMESAVLRQCVQLPNVQYRNSKCWCWACGTEIGYAATEDAVLSGGSGTKHAVLSRAFWYQTCGTEFGVVVPNMRY